MQNDKYVKAMNGEEIADELGISRQAVSQTIKRAVNKVYKGLVTKHKNSPANAFLQMQEYFGVSDVDDVEDLYKFLTKENMEAVKKDARNLVISDEQQGSDQTLYHML